MSTVINMPSVQTNATLATIYERRSVRKFRSTAVSRDIIEKILNAGRMAPSAINRQPWKFYVLTNKELIALLSKEIGRVAAKKFLKSGPTQIIKMIGHLLHFPHDLRFFKGDTSVFHGAPLVIFLTGPKDDEWAALDIGMCSQNIMLAARSLGLDTCPVGMGKYASLVKDFPRLHIPSREQIYLAIVLGYGDEHPEAHERKMDNAVYIK